MSANSSPFQYEALTFDDVLLIPAYSEVLPRETDIRSFLTAQIQINIPFLSAAMDTVTETDMAIAIAMDGGVGFIHKNMTVEKQAEQVRKVKRSQSGMILDPVTLSSGATIGEAEALMRDYRIGGIPIVDSERKLAGIITNRDMRFQKKLDEPVNSIMTKDRLITAPEGISLESAERILQEHKIEKLPHRLNKHGILTGLITYKDIQKKKNKPFSCKDEYGRLRVGAAVGVTADILERIGMLEKAGADVVSIDTAHGHSKGVIDAVKKAKQKYPNLNLIAGNIATQEAATALAKAGADAVKVGVGPGSICTTRVVAGIGLPQLSAIHETAKGLKGTPVKLIADGGIRFSGDTVKALAAGADSVMMGSLLAGSAEAPGETIIYEGRRFKSYRGMGSLEAMEAGSKDRYFQDAEDDIKKLVPEGISGRVPYKGPVTETLYQLVGGLRAGMGYCGAKDLAALKTAKFARISHAGVIESHPHDVNITREAPNYSRK